MITWNDLKHLDVKNVDLTKLDLSRFDVRNLPTFDLPTFDLPTFETPDVDTDRVFGFARDTAYAGVGVAVITAQKLDAQRRDVTERITAQVRKIVGATA